MHSFNFFKVVKDAAGMDPNLKKTLVLILSQCSLLELGELLTTCDIVISGLAKYLGVLIGPGALAERCKVQAARYRSRAALVASFYTS
eukprot:10969092-Heterocapsa_arctica.AAC.1